MHRVLYLFIGLVCVAFKSHADTVILNFDSVVVPPCCVGSSVDATSYLNSFGITFIPITPGITPVIDNATPFGPGVSAAIPTSAPNVFAANAAPGQANAPLSYELKFSEPLTSISFYRTAIISISTGPTWTASALNGLGDVVDSASEGRTFGPPARLVTLTGSDIEALRIDADNESATFTDPPIDNLTLTPQTPEPVTILLVASGLFGVVFLRYWLAVKQ